jgi:hypothetical protein
MRLGSWAVLLAATLAAVSPAQARERASHPNVRPFVDGGLSLPFQFGQLSSGSGIGAGFEAEQSSRLSAVFRVELHELTGEDASPYVYAGSYPLRQSATSWSLGVRYYPFGQGPFHPYGETSLGVRMMDGNETPVPDGSASRAVSTLNGVAATMRLGFTTARRGRPGLFVDAGAEIILHNPQDFGIAPIRAGVLFP